MHNLSNIGQQVYSQTYISLHQFITPFIAQLDIAHSSRDTYKRGVKRFFSWLDTYTKKEKIDRLEKFHLLLYKSYLDEKGLKPFTRSTYLVAIRRFFEWLEAHLIYPNIAKGLKGIRKTTKSHSKDSLSLKSIKKLLTVIKLDRNEIIGMRDYALIFLLINTGLRLIEVSKALLSDIEYISEQDQHILWIRGKGREGKDAFVVLSNNTKSVLSEYLRLKGLEISSLKDVPIFSSHSSRNKNKFITVNSLSRIVKERLREAGIKTKRITAHSLRHTFGVLSIESGASLYEVQLAMRHSSPQTTQVYLGDIEKKKRLVGAPEKKVSKLLSDIS